MSDGSHCVRPIAGGGVSKSFHGGALLACRAHELEDDDGAHAMRSADDTDRAHAGATSASRCNAASWQGGKAGLFARAGVADDGRQRARQMMPGQPLRREFEYIRHGTLTLMGALDVRRGKAFGFLAPKISKPKPHSPGLPES